MAKSRFKNENLFTYLWTPEMHSDSRESWVVILWLKSNSFFLSSFFLSSCWVKLGKPPPKLLVLDSASIISESYTSPTLWSSNLCLRNSRMGVKVSAASYGSALGREGPVQLSVKLGTRSSVKGAIADGEQKAAHCCGFQNVLPTAFHSEDSVTKKLAFWGGSHLTF